MYTSDGYLDAEDEYVALDPFHEEMPIELGRAEISALKVSLQAWMAKLVNGMLFEFQPGKFYDLGLLDKDGWINIRSNLLFVGAKDSTHGEFLNINNYDINKVTTTDVIVVARRSKAGLL